MLRFVLLPFALIATVANARQTQVLGHESLVVDINEAPLVGLSFAGGGFHPFGPAVYFQAGIVPTGAELWVADGTGENAKLLADIAPGDASSSPWQLAPVEGGFVFAATVGGADSESASWTGRELWFSDGTHSGTALLADINPGTASSDPFNLVRAGDHVFFTAFDGENGQGLWSLDASTLETVFLAGNTPPPSGVTSLSTPMALNDVVLFSATQSLTGRELWVSDGTAAGTQLVADLFPGQGSSSPLSAAVVGDALYFAAITPGIGSEPWISDGTEAGTRLLADLNPSGNSNPKNFTGVGDRIVFAAAGESAFEFDLWATDGTEGGTARILDVSDSQGLGTIYPGTQTLPSGEEVVFFTLTSSRQDPVLWRTNGTVAGTVPVSSVDADSELISHQGLTYFFVGGGAQPHHLWRTDGTSSGTFQVTQRSEGFDQASSLTSLGDRLWFTTHSTTKLAVWTSDGTSGGTTPVFHPYPGQTEDALQHAHFAVAGDRAFFRPSLASGPGGLWVTDGTAGGTLEIDADMVFPPAAYFSDQNWCEVDGRLVFAGSKKDAQTKEVWVSDGTGTEALSDFGAVTASSGITRFTSNGELAYFLASTPEHGFDLWSTDGASVEPIDLFPGSAGASWGDLALIDDVLYLGAWEADPADPSVYVYRPGAGELRRLVEGVSNVQQFTPVGDRVIFRGDSLARGAEVWVTDSTPAGTFSLVDANPGPESSNPEQLTSLGDFALFLASDASVGSSRIWATDGTHPGTFPLFPGEEQAPLVFRIAGVAGVGFFAARADGLDTLWVTDGTVAGTRVARTFSSGSWIEEIVVLGSGARALARIKTPEAGTEVWLSDGTAAGTYQLTETAFGSADADPGGFARVGNQLLFRANDGLHGAELHHLRFTKTEN